MNKIEIIKIIATRISKMHALLVLKNIYPNDRGIFNILVLHMKLNLIT